MTRPAPPVAFSYGQPVLAAPPAARSQQGQCIWFLEEEAHICGHDATTQFRLRLTQCDLVVPVCAKHKATYKHKSQQMRRAKRDEQK